jgi:hypothetical protein
LCPWTQHIAVSCFHGNAYRASFVGRHERTVFLSQWHCNMFRIYATAGGVARR